jgi:acyl-CoA synthetase (AMP-forming)/AMP-acid ligase II
LNFKVALIAVSEIITSMTEAGMKSFNHHLKAKTLVDILSDRATTQPNRLAYTFLVDGEQDEVCLTYQVLDQQARAIAAYLQSCCVPGDRVLLLYPSGLEYVAAFFGCLYAGVIAVPAYPPRPNQSLLRLQAILTDAKANLALTTQSVLSTLERQLPETPELKLVKWVSTDVVPTELAQQWQAPYLDGDAIAFLQYTSGSTAKPKGVMVSHNNLLHNLESIYQYFGHSPQRSGVIWLPLYHDMGLVGGVLQPLYGGFPVTLMSPLMFLQSPIRWLQAISHYRATTSGGPNFAYDLCVRKITPEQIQHLDLSCWDVAFNGAEPIHHETLQHFATRFATCGFHPEAFYPCYGMAEATLMITGGRKAMLPAIKTLNGEALEQNLVIPASPEELQARTVVGCGQALPNQQIVVVHPESRTQCATGEVGEIWVRGPSISRGYWQRLETTQQTFGAYLADTDAGPFLRTGDLGFMDSGELFVTGRLKDLIIISGRNYYPQDIERTVEQSHPAIRPACSAAFAVNISGSEQLVIVAEVERQYISRHRRGLVALNGTPEHQVLDAPNPIQSIRRAVAHNHDLPIHATLLLKPGSIPKTSSGKIQRHACQASFITGTLEVIEGYDSTTPDKIKAGV